MADLALDSIVLEFFSSGLAGNIVAVLLVALIVWVVWVNGYNR